MRLFHTTNFTITEFNADQVPRYAILSHRWRQDELTLQDVEAGSFSKKTGFWKVKNACRVAQRCGCDWLWIDTCCIDKRDAVDFNEAVNAMYIWYKQADLCIAYLFDHTDKLNRFSDSSWFTRCWTLQELIAPRDVDFYDSQWTFIGSKRNRHNELAVITGIPESILKGDDPRRCSVAQRMSWAANRKATRIEDEAYSLLGLFNLSMPASYGSGTQAFQFLQQRLLQQEHDQSILAWNRSAKDDLNEYKGLLAESPADFALCRNTEITESPIGSTMLVGDGVELNVNTIPYTMGIYLCVLDCTSTASDRCDAILLQQLDAPQRYARILYDSSSVFSVSKRSLGRDNICKRRKLYVHHGLRHAPAKLVHGIHIRDISLLECSESSYENIRILSRLKGCVTAEDPNSMVQLPSDEYGTAGIIYFPRDHPDFKHWPVRWIKIGFDDDFCPVVRLGFEEQTTKDLNRAIKHPPRHGTKEYKKIWSDHWMYQDLPKKTSRRSATRTTGPIEREYTDQEYFDYRGFHHRKAHPSEGLKFYEEYLGLKIDLKLKDCPSERLSQPLSVPRPGLWKVWTLDIEQKRHFEAEAHSLRTAGLAIATAAVGIPALRAHSRSRETGRSH